jgi:putative membrane protein
MRTWAQVMLCAAWMLPAVASADQTEHKTTDTTETAAGKRTTDLASASDRKFIEKAAAGGLAEVKLGQLAMDKGTSPQVKDFGKRMVDDHGKANDELKEIASKKNFPMPTDLDTKDKATYDKLSKLSGAAFDKAYMDAMVKDHDADVKEFKKEASLASADPDLKSFAGKTVKVLEEHQQMARQNKDALKK